MGPLSVSSRGRVGVSAGPVSWSGGGSSRRSGDPGLMAWLFLLVLIIVAVMWPLSLWGHALHLTPSWHQLMHRNKAWMHEHYPLVGLRYLLATVLLAAATFLAIRPLLAMQTERVAARQAETERQRVAAYRAWLKAPPTPVVFPGRFTQNWIEANVPGLHPGQLPSLIAELHARGWTDERIAQRVEP